MKLKRVLISAMLVMIIVFAYMICVSADDNQRVFYYEKHYDSAVNEMSIFADEVSLKSYLRQSLVACPDYIDISGFSISSADVDALFSLIWDDMTDMFHVNGIGYMLDGNIITELYFSYYYDAQTFSSMYTEFLTVADKMLDGIKGNDLLSDAQKALLLHDRLAVHCEYDLKNLNANTLPAESYMSYGALVSGMAVCQGYSEAYQYLLEQVGIESRVCSSDALYHAWNIVTIDGAEYHVDVTWDDPTYDMTGRVLHTNFLRSSAGIYSTGHSAYDFDFSPDDTKYDNYFWQTSTSEFQLLNGEIYFIDGTDNAIRKMSDMSTVYTIDCKWRADKYSYWNGYYSRLSTDGQTLLYNTDSAVCLYDPQTGTNRIIWEPDMMEGDYYGIYGFTYTGNYLVCDVWNTPHYELTTKDECVQKQMYDSTVPVVTVSVTNNIAAMQTVTLNVSDNDGIVGYYWGENASYAENSFTYTDSDKINISVSSEGTYYYAVEDTSGNVSNVGTLTFYKTTLDAASGNVIPESIITLSGNNVCLPIPVRDGYEFIGWGDSEASADHVFDICVRSNGTYYAVWQEIIYVSSVEIYSNPLKTEYYIGDTVDTEGLTLKVVYSNGTTDIIDSEFTVNDFDLSKSGDAELTAEYMGFSDTFKVTVKTPSITLSDADVNVELNNTFTVFAQTEPYSLPVVWTSSDESVVSVDNGIVTAHSKGSATITASVEYNYITYYAMSDITVICSHSDVTFYERIESTCIAPGRNGYSVCNICGDILSGSDELLPLAEHDYVENVKSECMVSAADCVSADVYYKSCSVCGIMNGEKFTYGSVDESNHAETAEKNQKNATCAEEGYTGDVYCTKCDCTLEFGSVTEKLAHTGALISGYASTCTKPGLSDGEQCIVCDTVIVEQTELPVSEHDYIAVTVAATCTESGYTIYTCSVCNDSQTSDYTDALSHSFSDWTDSAEDGIQERACSVCGKIEYRSVDKSDEEPDTQLPDDNANEDKPSDTDKPEQDDPKEEPDTQVPDDNTDEDKPSDTDEPEKNDQTEVPDADDSDDDTVDDIPENNKLILTDGSGFSINEEKKQVATAEDLTYETVVAQILNENIVILDRNGKEISSDSLVGTGCIIIVSDDVQYTVLLSSDVDGNGKVTAADARLALRASANLDKLEGVYAEASDYDGNGNITAADARMILRKSAGLEE